MKSSFSNSIIDEELLEALTLEVTKENPETKKLKLYMKKAGLKYTDDPVERINLVLKKMNFLENIED